MRRKGIYPHEYMDGWEKFEDTAGSIWKVTMSKIMNMHSKSGIE